MGLRRRLDRGVRLFQQGAAPLLVLSGGGAGPVPEAEIMRRMALDRGVPEAALLVETGSHDTLGNARETARLLRLRGGRSVLLVSDRAHLPAVSARRVAGGGLGRGAAAFYAMGSWCGDPRMHGVAGEPGSRTSLSLIID